MEEKNIEQPIDISKIARKIWNQRRRFYYVLPAVLIATYLLMVCIPRYYKCTVSLAPETSGTSISGSLESLASSFGLGSSLAKLNSTDALYAEIYPEVVASRNFIVELMGVNVKTLDGEVQCDYYTYLRDKQRAPWWDYLIMMVYGLFDTTPRDTISGKEKISVFDHTKKQEEIFTAIQGNIKCQYDKKTDIFSITVKDQDPLVCATMADTTCLKLQEFITKYRTNKARIDYEYYKSLCEKSKSDYEAAQIAYANCADAHKSTILATYQAKVERLENEMQTKQTIYSAMNSQMQAAAAKLQEATPAFTVIESASIPHKPAGPKRMIISILMTILAFFAMSLKILKEKES